MMWKDPHRYDDMLSMERPVSKSHRPMPMEERAAQFSPFAALTGYDAAIRETARLTDEKAEISEEKKEELDRILRELSARKMPQVTVTYFEKDSRKEGGAYRVYTGILKKADQLTGKLVFADGTAIPLSEIAEIETREENEDV